MYLLGSFRLQMKKLLYGDFKKNYNNGYIGFRYENRMLRKLKILDYSEQYLIEG